MHIADAPCHGREFHDDDCQDKYPDGDPGKNKLDDLMKKLARREIIYHFGYIEEKDTSLMITKFNQSLMKEAGMTTMIRTFDASQLTSIGKAVYRLITESISTTVQREQLHFQKRNPTIKCKSVVHNQELDWSKVESHTMKVSGLSCSVVTCVPNKPTKIKKMHLPFEEGSLRYAYHGLIEESDEHIVLKEYKSRDERFTCLKQYVELALINAVSAQHAAEFNAKLPGSSITIEVLPIGVAERPARKYHKLCYFAYEKYLVGEYRKYNNNFGKVQGHEYDEYDTCQAFSHFTWVNSKGRQLVCDVQGVQCGNKVILSDLAIHDKNVLLYGTTNLGVKGIKKFFTTHKCNNICSELRLIQYCAKAFAVQE